LGKLLVIPANVRLDWKVIASYKHSSLFGLIVSDERKAFYNIDTWSLYHIAFCFVVNKLVCLSISNTFILVLYMQARLVANPYYLHSLRDSTWLGSVVRAEVSEGETLYLIAPLC
jgi:hypothetical protein